MSRKTAVSELQSRETTDSHSPIRRSARIFSGNNTPSGLGKRNSQADGPAKETKTRRGSTQFSEDDTENTKKDLTNKDSQQAPARRGRKSSVTFDTASKEEPEKPKTVRTRRNSRAASEEKEKPPPKAIKGRKSSIISTDLEVVPPSTSKVAGRRKRSDSVDSEPAVPVSKAPSRRKRSESADIKTESPPATTKIPTRASTRRRNSMTEEAGVEGTLTPVRRSTRGRKTSDSENVEEDVKPILRRGRRSSTEETTVNTPSKTPKRLTRRNSLTLETGEEVPTEESYKEISVKITPIKKKLVEKVEAELDLSVINESAGDLNVSKQSLTEEIVIENIEMAENNLPVKVTPIKSVTSEEVLVEQSSVGNSEQILNDSIFENSPTSRKRPRADDHETSRRKSPKVSLGSHINSESSQVLTPIQSKRDTSVSIESVKFPLSSVSMPDSTTLISDTEMTELNTSKDSNKENLDVEEVLISKHTPIKGAKIQEDVLNTSKDSNKENLDAEEVFMAKETPIQEAKVQEDVLNTSTDSRKELNASTDSRKENLDAEEVLIAKETPIKGAKVQEDVLNTSKDNNKENLDVEEVLIAKETPIKGAKVQEDVLNTSTDSRKENLDVVEVLISKETSIKEAQEQKNILNISKDSVKENFDVEEVMTSKKTPVKEVKVQKDVLNTSKDSRKENLDVQEVIISKGTPIKEVKVQKDVLNTSKDSTKENLDVQKVIISKGTPIKEVKVQKDVLNASKDSRKENLDIEEGLISKETPTKEAKIQEDALNISKKRNEENLSSKFQKPEENCIEAAKEAQEHALNTSKDINEDDLDIEEVLKSKKVHIEAPIINTRISNVFRPNQKENSFVVEPMEVDDLSIISADNSIFDKISASGENSVVSGNAPKSDGIADTTIKTVQESSSIFNKSITSSAEIELTTDISSALQDVDVTTVEKVIRINATGSEESDNVLVEETEDSVDISCIPKFKKTDAAAQAIGCSVIINATVDNVKILNRKSSSPISQKKLLRRSKSPITIVDSSSDNEDEDSHKLRINTNKVKRRSKLKSKTPSPKKLDEAKITALESAGTRRSSVIEDLVKSPLEKYKDLNTNKLKVDKPNRKSKSKSPSPVRTIESASVVTPPKSATSNINNVESRKAKIKRTSEGTSRQSNADVEINLQGSDTPNLSPPRNKRLSRSPTFIPWENDSSKVRLSRGNRITTTPVDTKKDFTISSSGNREILHSNDTTPTRKKSRTPTKLLNIESENGENVRKSTSNTTTPNPQNVNEDESEENIDLESKSNQSPSDTSGDIEKSRSDPKFSQSTHYDFELPSDDEPICNGENMGIAEVSAVLEKDASCAESLSPVKNQSARLLETTVAINSNELNFSKMSGFSNTDTIDLNESVQQKSIHNVENVALESSESHEKSSSDNSKTTSFKENEEVIEIIDDKEISVTEDKSKLGNRLPEFNVDEDDSVIDEESNARNNKTKENSMEKALSTLEPKKLPKITCLLTRLEDFASAKLHELTQSSNDQESEELSSEEEGSSSDEDESEQEYNDFIDGMAEEGEEDTPSEDSNQIVDEGEYIGSSETEEYRSDDDYDSKDSFICDEEEYELISGEEYDLDSEKEQKKESTVVNISEEKDDLVNVAKKKSIKSRIIRPKDSSSEDEEDKVLMIEAGSTASEKSIVVVEDSPFEQSTADEIGSQKDSKFTFDNSPESLNTNEPTKSDNQEIKANASNIQNISIDTLNNSTQKRNRKTSLSLQENIVFDGIKDPMISQRISTLVESFCSTVTKGEVSLNLSLEYEGTPSQDKEKQKTASVKVLSSIKICPASGPDNDSLEEPKETSIPKDDLSRSLDGESRKRKKKLKRRLSKSLSELCEEETQSKRRRKNSSKAQPNMKPAESYNLMSQLITDVKNRPKRTIKPSLLSNLDSSWIASEVVHLKPSTTAASKEEMFNFKAKLHPKDFKNKLLSDPTRVKRIETKTLLKKKGAFL